MLIHNSSYTVFTLDHLEMDLSSLKWYISKSNTSVEFMKISEIVVIIFIKHCVSMALELFHVCEDKF